VLTEWRERWHKEQGRKASWPESIAALDQPSQSCLKLYSQLKKAESSVLFQARTGRIGFRRFLASVRVPGVESDECLCERGKETAEHVLLHCDNTPQRVWSRGAQFQKLASELFRSAHQYQYWSVQHLIGQYFRIDQYSKGSTSSFDFTSNYDLVRSLFY
jgi:hypothetical protein